MNVPQLPRQELDQVCEQDQRLGFWVHSQQGLIWGSHFPTLSLVSLPVWWQANCTCLTGPLTDHDWVLTSSHCYLSPTEASHWTFYIRGHCVQKWIWKAQERSTNHLPLYYTYCAFNFLFCNHFGLTVEFIDNTVYLLLCLWFPASPAIQISRTMLCATKFSKWH